MTRLFAFGPQSIPDRSIRRAGMTVATARPAMTLGQRARRRGEVLLRPYLVLALMSAALVACAPTSPLQTPSPIIAPATPTIPPVRTPAAAGRCGDGVCAGPENPQNCPSDCRSQPSMIAATPTSTAGKGVLYLGIIVHLEGWPDDENEARFKTHAALVREYADLFERYGARLTLESKEFTEGCLHWGDNVLKEMEQRGHGIGVHADVGGEKNYDCSRFATDLRAKKEQLEALGVTVRHVSGIVSHCDWVTAAADAGYLFTTGQVAYSVMSLPPEKRPPEFRNCPNPAACHQPFPTELKDRIHPWRMSSGTDWLTHDPKGRLVLLPSSGGLACMQEETSSPTTSHTGCEFTQEDIDAFIRQLEEALSYVEPDKVNIYYISWSLGKSLDKGLLETWLQRIQPYVQSGRVEWKTLPQMYDAYVAWEQGGISATPPPQPAGQCPNGYITFAVNAHDIRYVGQSADTILRLIGILEIQRAWRFLPHRAACRTLHTATPGCDRTPARQPDDHQLSHPPAPSGVSGL